MPRMLYVSGPTESYPIASLADYVRRIRNEKNLSLAQVSSRSYGRMGKTRINRIENGPVNRGSLFKLRALALGIDVPEDDLIAVTRGKPARKDLTENEAKLLSNFRQLYADRREDVLIMLNALAARFPH